MILHLVLKLTDLVFQVIHTEFVQHYHIMITVLSQQTLEADTAQVVLAEGLDIFRLVDTALSVTILADLVVLRLRHFHLIQIIIN